MADLSSWDSSYRSGGFGWGMSGKRLEATRGSKEDTSPAFWPLANGVHKRKHNHCLRLPKKCCASRVGFTYTKEVKEVF